MTFLKDVGKKNKRFEPKVIFDIGANKGLLTAEFANQFPDAKVYAFEPAKATFEMLSSALGDKPNVSLHHLALDLAEGVVQFTNAAGSTGNHIVRDGDKGSPDNVENVDMVSGDHFCKSNGIEKIDFLKIDTEGNDLRVLAGFSGMLREKKVNYIQVECATSLDNRFHVHLERFIHFLHPFNYRLYHIYEPTRIVYKTQQRLNGIWFCNAVFVLEKESPRLRRDGNN